MPVVNTNASNSNKPQKRNDTIGVRKSLKDRQQSATGNKIQYKQRPVSAWSTFAREPTSIFERTEQEDRLLEKELKARKK